MFAQRISTLSSSIIREILAAAQQPGVISFAGGLPAADSFPEPNWSALPPQIKQSYNFV